MWLISDGRWNVCRVPMRMILKRGDWCCRGERELPEPCPCAGTEGGVQGPSGGRSEGRGLLSYSEQEEGPTGLGAGRWPDGVSGTRELAPLVPHVEEEAGSG